MKKLQSIAICLYSLFIFNTTITAQADSKKVNNKATEVLEFTFKGTRIINNHSVETLKARKMAFRIGHRFGDLAGINGGWETFYGLENASDVLIGLEYGLNNALTVGLSRTKGGGPLSQLVHGTAKYRLLSQTKDNSMPISMTVLGISSMSTVKASDNPNSLSYFPEGFSHRMSYALQVLLAKRFGYNLSLQLSPMLVHRNLTLNEEDPNTIINVGASMRWQFSHMLSFIVDSNLPINTALYKTNGISNTKYYIPLGFGLEFDTGGHVFQINLTNTRGIVATDYIPYSNANWLNGEYRLGFTISRLFNM